MNFGAKQKAIVKYQLFMIQIVNLRQKISNVIANHPRLVLAVSGVTVAVAVTTVIGSFAPEQAFAGCKTCFKF